MLRELLCIAWHAILVWALLTCSLGQGEERHVVRFRGGGTRNDNPAFCGSVVKAAYSSFMERFFWVTKNSVHIDLVALQDVSISITLPLEAAFTAGSVLVGTSGAGRREKERDGREEARYCYHFEVLLPLRYSPPKRGRNTVTKQSPLKRGQGTVSIFLKLQTS